MDLCVGNTSGTENCGGENSHTSNPDPLLHDLKPDDQLDAAASVQFARADTEKHGNVRLGLSSLSFEFCDIANILELGLGLSDVFTSLATESPEYVTGLFLSPDLDEPTRRFGEEPTNGEEHKQWGDLERDRESPGEFSGTTFIEVAPAV